MFQCSSASRKFLNNRVKSVSWSVKIGFSALQRAENSSIGVRVGVRVAVTVSFSALQRAENSSISWFDELSAGVHKFQCSSASRKFLNQRAENSSILSSGFSALQRAENSSIASATSLVLSRSRVSVLFSEPKIPQLIALDLRALSSFCFSALQRAENSSIDFAAYRVRDRNRFQCSSASRKFLNACGKPLPSHARRFQCSSASRKFLNRNIGTKPESRGHVSVLFSEPKIPQCLGSGSQYDMIDGFSALQRAENSSIARRFALPTVHSRFSALQRAENSSISRIG